MKSIKTLLLLLVIARAGLAQNADPGISIIISPPSVPLGSTSTLSATVGNYGNDNILASTLRIIIGVGTSAEITGLASGTDPKWAIASLSSGAGNTIRLINTGGGFTSFDIGDVLLTVEGVVASTPDLILGTIGYVTGNNPALGGAPNASQGNASTGNNNAQTSLEVLSNGTLPVELIDFSVAVDDNNAVGKWSVGLEYNVSHYEIEHSFDAMNFEFLKPVAAEGASFYNFTDEMPTPGNHYYRIKIIDKDGLFSYSNIVNIKISAEEPNYLINTVVTAILRIQIPNNPTEKNIQIYDTGGQLLFETNLKIIDSELNIDIQSYPRGNYVVRFFDRNNQKVERFVME